MLEVESEIEAFHRAGRRRKSIAFVVLAVFATLAGLIAILVGVLSFGEIGGKGGAKIGLWLVVSGGVGVATGVVFAVTAWRLGRGKINDIEY